MRGARQLLTLRGASGPRRGWGLQDLGLIQDGAVLIRDGVIASVGPSRRVENLSEARSARELDATGRVVMPGFVDSHTHFVCGPLRLTDYEELLAGAPAQPITENAEGIRSSVRAVRSLSSTRLLLQARRTLETFIRHGTTTLEGKSGYGLDETGELKTLRVMATLRQRPLDVLPTYFGAHTVPLEYQGRADDYLDWMCSHLLPIIRRRRLARFVDAACGPAGFSCQQARRYFQAAQALGFLLKVHAEQSTHSGGARLAVELGAVSADHLAWADPQDVALLAASPTIATLLPGPVFHLGLDRYPPARALIEAGAAVALGTDFNPGTSPSHSLPAILALACSQMRLTPAEAVSAATINGAHALGMGGRVGSLEAGKQADLIVLDVPDYREIPYHYGVNLVAMTLKRGEILYRQGEVRWPDD